MSLKIGESQLDFLSLGGAWFCPNLASLDQGAVPCPQQFAIPLSVSGRLLPGERKHGEAGQEAVRAGGGGGRAVQGALPGLPEESSPRSTACRALWGRSLLPRSSARTDCLFLLPDSST